MRVTKVALSTTLVALTSHTLFGQGGNGIGVVGAFTIPPSSPLRRTMAAMDRTIGSIVSDSPNGDTSRTRTSLFATVESNPDDDDCGCASPAATIYTGNPSSAAQRNINHRAVLSNAPIYSVDGTQTSLDGIIGTIDENETNQQISMVVFLRSLG